MPDPTKGPLDPIPRGAGPISVEPVISFPRRARPGSRCVLTVDLRHELAPEHWPYAEEEYELRCVLDARPLFSHRAVGDVAVVLHRYGGSYGPATFVLTAAAEEMTGNIRITLVNRAGLPTDTLELEDIRIARGAETAPAQTQIRIQEEPNGPLELPQVQEAPVQEAPETEEQVQEVPDDTSVKRRPLPLDDRKRFFQQCGDGALEPGDARYVKMEGARGIGVDFQSQLAEVILYSDAPTCQLVCAQRGAGLTTELLQLGARLGPESHVVHVDFEEFVDVFAPFDHTDVLRTIAYAIVREAAKLEGKDPSSTDGYPASLFRMLEKIVPELREIESQPFGPSLMLELRNSPNLRATVRRALQMSERSFVDDVRESIALSVARIGACLRGTGPVVVVLDGLGKATTLRPEDRPAMVDALVSLFTSTGELLRLPCHAIYDVPLWLRHHDIPMSRFADAEVRLLPHIQTGSPDGQSYLPGLHALTEIVRRRVDVERVFGVDSNRTLDRLIVATGGCVRDLLRLVREVLTGTDEFPVDPGVVERTNVRYRETFSMALYASDIEMLVTVAKSHMLKWDLQEPYRIDRLLATNTLLIRLSDAEWYEVHPLVHDFALAHERL